MASRDSRYRSQVAVERRKVERYRTLALDAVAALTVSTAQDWSDLLGPGGEADLDRAEVARRVEVLRRKMGTRTR